ncbi:MAG: MFS transporter [Desulfurococcales archaeon]|nr:MFS transporter [Desulfurococcales archaeon]
MTENPGYRWIVLSIYILSGIASQLIWITYAPILSTSAKFYHVSENEVSLFAAVFPLIYLIISIPVGYFIDKYGFRRALITGMLFLGVFSVLRSITASFIIALAFQVIAGIGQPFVMNSVSKLVRSWFPEEETALATGLGTLSLMLGIIIALALTPILVSHIGLTYTLAIYGGYSIITLFLVYILVKEPVIKYGEERVAVGLREMIIVLKNRNILILSTLFFLGVGAYTAFTTWVEPLVKATGVPLGKAGVVGSLLTIGGIIGSVVIPGIADKISSRKKPMIYALLIAVFLWLTPYFAHGTTAASIELFITGFFFLSLAPLSLDLSAVSVGIKYSGAANSVLWEFSQIGSLILIWLFEVISEAKNWLAIYPLISILVLVMFILSLGLKEENSLPDNSTAT